MHSWFPNEEGYATTDMESDQLHVPASFFHFIRRMASGQAKNRNVTYLVECIVAAIWFLTSMVDFVNVSGLYEFST